MFFQLFGGAIFLSKNVIISLVTSSLTSSNKCVENQKRLFGIVMQWRNIFFSFLRMYAMSIVVVKKAFRWASKFSDANIKRMKYVFANMQFEQYKKDARPGPYLLPFWRYFIDIISTGGRIIWSFFFMRYSVICCSILFLSPEILQ